MAEFKLFGGEEIIRPKQWRVRDAFTRPHGEFSHAIQWLVLGMMYGTNVAQLYEHSVNYRSRGNFRTLFGN